MVQLQQLKNVIPNHISELLSSVGVCSAAVILLFGGKMSVPGTGSAFVSQQRTQKSSCSSEFAEAYL